MIAEWLLLGVVVLLTAATGVFVAAEFSLITVDRSDVERQAEAGDSRAASVLAGITSLSTQLSGAQVGITVTTLIAGFLVKESLAPILEPAVTLTGVSEAAVSGVAVVAAVTITTVFSMLLGELVPKNLALSLPEPTARWSVPLQRGFTWVSGPIITLLNSNANRVLSWFGIQAQEELRSGRSPDELIALVQRSADQGTLAPESAELITKSLSFGQLTAADVMTPRVQMTTLGSTATAADVVSQSRATGLSRFPVVQGDSDQVVGFVHVKGAIGVPYAEREQVRVTEFMRSIMSVPETIRLSPLLAQLKSAGWHAALVQDEYGGTAGIVTLEDVVEEIVGEVDDEHDKESPQIQWLADRQVYSVPGLVRPDELREEIPVSVPDSPAYETIAGFMNHSLRKLAMVGDRVDVSEGTLVVDRVKGRRIDRVLFEPSPQWLADQTPGDATSQSGGAL